MTKISSLELAIQAYDIADKKYKDYKVAKQSFKSIMNDLTNVELRKFMKHIED